MKDQSQVTMVYILGVASSLYHGANIGVAFFWPWYIGKVIAAVGF